MKVQSVSILVVLTITAIVCAFSGGDGSDENPYQISTKSHLEAVQLSPSLSYILLNDIDLAGANYTAAIIPEFNGKFDGKGFIIKNFTIDAPEIYHIGLFGKINSGAAVSNLGVEGFNITGNGYVGGLTGSNYGSIKGCFANGSTTSLASVSGGLIGYNNSFVESAYASGNIDGSLYVGGLIGRCDSYSIVRYCYSTAAPTGSSNVGGLIGYNYGNVISSLWDIDSSGQATGSVGIGKTTVEMKDIATYKDNGWPIADLNGADTDWIMTAQGQEYPVPFYFAYRSPQQPIAFAGSGTQQQPFIISTPEDLVSLSQYTSLWSSNFAVEADLDMSGIDFRPIGNSRIRFSGSFNGQNYNIENLTINLPEKSNVGLFGTLASGAQVGNLSIVDADIIGGKFVGALAGFNSGGGVSNCSSSGQVSGSNASCVGGLVGTNLSGTISNSTSNADISGINAVAGGLVGYNSANSTIEYSHSTSAVVNYHQNQTDSYSGGLVGINALGTISNCSAAGSVSAISNTSGNLAAGGLIGDNKGTVSECFATGDVQALTSTTTTAISAGGLFGLNNRGTANSCYSTGNISSDIAAEGDVFAGGFMGINFEGLATSSYSKGAINTGSNDKTTGGFAGFNLAGRILSCFWDKLTSGITTGGAAAGKSTAEMKSMETYQNAGWFGKGWVIDDAADYPSLQWQGAAGEPIAAAGEVPLIGSGAEQDPYQIWTVEDFNIWQQHASVLDKHTILKADLNFNGLAVNPIGEYGAFTGKFDGNGFTISKLTINQPNNSFVGLFRHIGEGGIVTNLGLEDASIAGLDYVGGIVGFNEGGTIEKCYASGDVASSGEYAGGFAGDNYGGEISQSYSLASVSGAGSYTGGFVGQNANNAAVANIIGTITNCYSAGAVAADQEYVGGFIGFGETSSVINNSFWDTLSSGQTSGTGTSAVGSNTNQMNSAQTFTSAGWDYNTVWKQNTGYPNGYPILKWQRFVGDFSGDDIIDIDDFLMLAEDWLNQSQPQADINKDGSVDMVDYMMFSNQWHRTN